MKKIKEYITRETLIAITVLFTLTCYFFFSDTFQKDFWKNILIGITILGSIPLLFEIIKEILKKNFGVDLIALIAITTSLLVGEYVAAAIILLMLSGGEALERFAEGRARNSLEKLLDHAPTTAHKFVNEKIEDVPVQDITIGEQILIKPNEVVPVDGIVVFGVSSIDESMITGEPMPREVNMNQKIWSGSINGGNVIIIEATTNYEQSTFSAIIRLVEEAEKNKAPMVRLADRYSIIFSLITFVLAGIGFFIDPKIAAAVLVVATPCPLILAAPIAFIAGMSRSAKKGIIVKHGGVFESLLGAKVFFFDKTGTLTFGIPNLHTIISYSSDYPEDSLLKIGASIEQFSTHILARSVVQKAKDEKQNLFTPLDMKDIVGQGVSAVINRKTYTIGKLTFLESIGTKINEEIKASSVLAHERGDVMAHVAEGGNIIGSFIFSDTIRENTFSALNNIKRKGIELVLVTGDSKARAESIGTSLGFSEIKSECMPEDKVRLVKESEDKGKHTVMIGDGINDAPALGAASVGIALGHHGATASTDTADAIILIDDISKVSELVHISQKTMRIAKESVFTGMGLSILAMCFALGGYLPPVLGALLQEGIDVVVILNALRALRD